MKFPEVECRACGKTVRPKPGHVSVKMLGKIPSYRGIQYACPECGEKAIWEPDERLSSEQARCPSVNPENGSRCVMAWNHFGPHNVGGPYKHNQTERWVTKCEDEPCVYHEIYSGYEQCINCGDRREIER